METREHRAELYKERALKLRADAERTTSQRLKERLLIIASHYENLAAQALEPDQPSERLSTQQCEPPAAMPALRAACKIARNIGPTREISQRFDLVAKERNLVGSGFDAKRDPTQETGSPLESMTCVRSQVGSFLEAISHR